MIVEHETKIENVNLTIHHSVSSVVERRDGFTDGWCNYYVSVHGNLSASLFQVDRATSSKAFVSVHSFEFLMKKTRTRFGVCKCARVRKQTEGDAIQCGFL